MFINFIFDENKLFTKEGIASMKSDLEVALQRPDSIEGVSVLVTHGGEEKQYDFPIKIKK